MSARREAIEKALVREVADVRRLQADLDEATGRRDRRIVELRALPSPPSLRYLADLTGVSHTQIQKIEEAPR